MKELYASLLSSTDLDNEKCLLSRGWEDSILWQVEESEMSHRNCDQFSLGEASSSRSDPSFTFPAYHWLHLIIPRAQAREWSRAGAGRRWVLDIRIDILFQLQWFQMWQGSKPTDLQGTVGGWWHESERNAGLVVGEFHSVKRSRFPIPVSSLMASREQSLETFSWRRQTEHPRSSESPRMLAGEEFKWILMGRGQSLDQQSIIVCLKWKEDWEIILSILLPSFQVNKNPSPWRFFWPIRWRPYQGSRSSV